MNRHRVLVVDDHRLVLEAVRAALENEPEIDVVGEALSGAEALALLEATSPDVVLLDLAMPLMDGLECLDAIKARFPHMHVVVLTGNEDHALAGEAVTRGAAALVSKRVDPHELAAVIRGAIEDDALEGAERDVALTHRENDVLSALADGLSNKQIAFRLHVGEQAVKYHLTNVFRKLDTKNRVDALRRATELGLVS